MRNNLIRFSTGMLIVTLLFSSSCKKYLDQLPDDRITIEQVFQKKGPSEQYLANVYSHIDDLSDQWNLYPWIGNADEVDITWSKYNIYSLNQGNVSAGTPLFDKWGTYYQGIRSATYFINHIDGNAEIIALNGQQLINQYKAEARFLRAYFYFLLMEQYGPVVLIGDQELPIDAPADALQLPRSPYDVCVDYVSSELDKAAAALPRVPSNNGQPSDTQGGRATVGMALAVKSRLLLYAASPLYNGNVEYSGFKNLDGTVLINQTYDQQKWKKAADAAKAVIDLGIYSLYKDPSGDPVKSYNGIFFQPWNSEQIFVRKDNILPTVDRNALPRIAGGYNGVGVTQEQVDAYFMADGLPIGQSPLYSETGFTKVGNVQVYNMYINREPRFYASVIYNNSMFQGGKMTAPAAISLLASGPNGKKGHATDWSKTGYIIKKNLGTETNPVTKVNQNRPLVLFRLAEIYLNYAEALNEYDPGNPDITKYLNMVRDRAGIPQYGSSNLPAPSGQSAMRPLIWQERRVEMAFESLRWFDIRRWKIAQQVMGDMHGMDINKDDDTFYKRVVASTHLFRAKTSYWFPIGQPDLDRSRLIVQNPGW